MTKQAIYSQINKASNDGEKKIALLLDPDKLNEESINKVLHHANENLVDYIFVGGSLMVTTNFENCVKRIKSLTTIPVIIFPGSPLQISKNADGILLLSLISGRNPEFLIGQHVIAAPYLKQSALEILPTGYILIESGRQTSASYMSNTTPIPYDKDEIAACTAMAGEMLGLKCIYLDGGSGAEKNISNSMIKAVKKAINTPLIVGGGIRTSKQAYEACQAGADIIVIGNAAEKNPELIKEIAETVHQSAFQNL